MEKLSNNLQDSFYSKTINSIKLLEIREDFNNTCTFIDLKFSLPVDNEIIKAFYKAINSNLQIDVLKQKEIEKTNVKNCPFCKCKPIIKKIFSSKTLKTEYVIGCSTIGCVCNVENFKFGFSTVDEALEIWNDRK